MIFTYSVGGNYKETPELTTGDHIWYDLINPTLEEEKRIEEWLEIEVPTREEMAEIELSNRLYQDDGVHYLTTIAIAKADTDSPQTTPVTFIITHNCLVTMRYEEIGSFRQYVSRLGKHRPVNHVQVFNGIVESIINRTADILERVSANIDITSKRIFTDKKSKNRHEVALTEIGANADLVSKARESLITMNRAIMFASNIGDPEEKAQTDIMVKDIIALTVHADFLSNKITFLLDAALGMINYEQNNIIKIFTLAALIFLPPTLIAGIYGMNFHSMPELDWHYGYPLALTIMLISAYLPYRYFKKNGWL